MKSLKLSDYFEIIHPKYTYLKITSHRSVRNYNTTNILKSISNTYRALNKRIKIENKKLIIEGDFKISYLIDIYKNEVGFYFIIPRFYKNILIEKIREVWSAITIEEVDSIPRLDGEFFQLSYKNEDALSIDVNKKSNAPLNNILNVIDIMKEEDRVSILYNFIPCSQIGWKEAYNETISKIDKNKPITKDKKSFEYVIKGSVNFIASLLDIVVQTLNDFIGTKGSDDINIYAAITSIFEEKFKLSNATKSKRDSQIIKTQIGICSNSSDITRKENNLLSVCQAYRVLDEDNSLVYKKTKQFKINDYDIRTDKNIMSVDECTNFIQLPGKELLQQFDIAHIDTTETEVPRELQEGKICIGENTYKGKKQKAYLSTDTEYQNLTTCICGPTRAGKTTLLANMSKNAIDNNETVIVFDFCGNCELSKDISRVIDNSNTLDINCSDTNKIEGFGYNEMDPKSDNDFEIYKSCKSKTQQLLTLIDLVNLNNPLEPRMRRYLESACNIVFINNGSTKDIFAVLQNNVIREEYIRKSPKSQTDNLQEYISALNELNDYSKSTGETIGTKLSYTQGIMNRVSKLKANVYMEIMIKKDCKNNIDLSKEIQIPRLITIRIPETMFSTEEEKDLYCMYWLSKIWSALQVRFDSIEKKDRTKVNIIIDELYQVPLTQNFLKTKINQISKKNACMWISCHSLEQIKYIRPELKSANTSYMLIAGCNKDNYNELKEELEPYELEDLLNLKRYHSLNLIKCNNGYSKFITKLPKELKKKS